MSIWIKDEIKKVHSNLSTHTWTPEDYRFLLERVQKQYDFAREAARREKHAKLREIARQQGVKPIKSIKELQGDFWPEDESVDDFLELVRAIRHQDKISDRTNE